LNNLQIIESLQEEMVKYPKDYRAVEDLFNMCRILESEDKRQAHVLSKLVREECELRIVRTDNLDDVMTGKVAKREKNGITRAFLYCLWDVEQK